MTSNPLSDRQLNALLPPLSPWARFGSLGVVALLGSTIALANAIPHRSTTQANAIVAPNGTIQALVPAESIDSAKRRLRQRIAPQQIAQMRVTACPAGEFGTLTGQVTTIATQPALAKPAPSAIATDSIVTQLSQPTLYAVTIQPQTLILKQASKSCLVRVGMQGKLDIVLREEPLARSLLRRMRLDGI